MGESTESFNCIQEKITILSRNHISDPILVKHIHSLFPEKGQASILEIFIYWKGSPIPQLLDLARGFHPDIPPRKIPRPFREIFCLGYAVDINAIEAYANLPKMLAWSTRARINNLPSQSFGRAIEDGLAM